MSPEQRSLHAAIQRCYNPKAAGHKSYAAKNIQVHGEWRSRGGFERFLAHIGRRPTLKHTLDRINNDGNYEPGNVRWATRKEQSRNTSRTVMLSGNRCLLDVANDAGIPPTTLSSRLKKGVPLEEAILPGRRKRSTSR